jgi:hypothetical protein
MRPLCAVDIECDGLHWSRAAWEIALVRRHPDGNEQVKVMLLDIDLRRADTKALEIGGFYDRHPRGIYLSTGRKPDFHSELTSPDQAAYWVHRLTFGASIVGAQPHFDTHVFARLLHAQGLQPSWHYRMYDVESLTAGHHNQRIGGLAACAESLGIPFPDDEQHTALGDARMALRIWDAIITEEGA